ncbi:MAG TPA: acyl-CoA reductase [Myxococcota bacterium]|nr:acyl-CoA reductase [Myxococcota bacterium]
MTPPSPDEICGSLERLRGAARAIRRRPARETHAALARVLDGWRDAASPWRRGLEEELPARAGFSPENVRAGLDLALAPLAGEALHELVARELGGVAGFEGSAGTLVTGFETCAVLLAGALPTPTLVALVAPLALRSGVFAKTSLHDPVTAAWLARSLADADPELAACLAVASFRGDDADRTGALLAADCVAASGSDETIARLRARILPPRRFVARGHRVSAAALGRDALRGQLLAASAEGLALDVALWDQLGCLSPVSVFAVGGRPAGDRVAEALAEALERAERRLPRGRLAPEAAAAVARESEEAEFRAAAGRDVRVLAGANASWTVVREEDARLRPAPLHRFVRVVPVEGEADLVEALGPLGPHLAAVALAGFGGERGDVARRLAELGASRLCAPGRMQAPPLAWHQDGQGVLLPFARFADLEPASIPAGAEVAAPRIRTSSV